VSRQWICTKIDGCSCIGKQPSAIVSCQNYLKGGVETAPERPTLRDQFAMAALTGLVARMKGLSMTLDAYDIAHNSWVLADAMMKERSRET
jgi:hypothetical protein